MPETKDIEHGQDLVIQGGDFNLIDSDSQHIEHILRAERGQWRQNPLIGAGLERELNGSARIQYVKQLIKLQLRADSMVVQRISIGLGIDNELAIDVKAKRQE